MIVRIRRHTGHMSRSSIAPRRTCTCGRLIAVVGGYFVRHDPITPARLKPGTTRRPRVIVLCPGSLTQCPPLDLPDRAGTPSLYELLAEGDGADAPQAPTLEQELAQMQADLLVSA